MPEPLEYAKPQEHYAPARTPMMNKWALDFVIWLAKLLLVFAALVGFGIFALLVFSAIN